MLSTDKFLSHFKKMDWGLVFLAVLLTSFGLVAIYSSSFFSQDFSNFKKQAIFLVVGLFLMIGISFFDWKMFKESPYWILTLYILSLISLGLVLLIGPKIQGVRGWYKIGSFSLDPIEPAKIILIILLAKYFSMRHIEMYNILHILISGFYVFLPCFFIFLRPDLGSVLILMLLWLGILFVSGIETKHFFILMFCVILIFVFSWSRFLKEYQRQRIVSFIAPTLEPLGMGWSSLQSRIAIGAGGLWGKGFRTGSQTQLGFLTAPQTDFTFAVIAEEFGFLGVSVLFLLILALFSRIIRIAFLAETNFEKLFALGFAILFSSQVFINIGMTLGILPVIGISLPFVSYGGSGLLINFIALGILQNIKTSLN